MENTDINLERKESSIVGDSKKGLCSEAPQNGAAGQNPVEHGVGETPLTGEKNLSPCSLNSENLEGLTEKIGTLGLQVTRKTAMVQPKSRRGRPSLQRILLGTLAAANLGPL